MLPVCCPATRPATYRTFLPPCRSKIDLTSRALFEELLPAVRLHLEDRRAYYSHCPPLSRRQQWPDIDLCSGCLPAPDQGSRMGHPYPLGVPHPRSSLGRAIAT